MLHLPRTPTKADDGIEKVKKSLSAKWGITLPVRDSTWSPSQRDPKRREDRILAVIQFLFFKGGALDCALELFDKHALSQFSHWQFKARAELDVLPSREISKSALHQDFLRKRKELEPTQVEELTVSLYHFLSQVADRVKAGETFPRLPPAERTEGKDQHPLPFLCDRLLTILQTGTSR